MKQIDKMSRLTGALEKCFRMLNDDLFNGELPAPIITVVPSSRSYAHYTPWDAWETKDGGKREINIASGTLDRPLENTIASLVHEMVHMYNDIILNEQDTSRGGTYHNKIFRREATAHGLTCTRSEKYGWSHTKPSDKLIAWMLEHDELREIEICRTSSGLSAVGIGTHSSNSNTGITLTGTNPNSHSRRYSCPCCGTVIRATKKVNIVCGDCMTAFVEG